MTSLTSVIKDQVAHTRKILGSDELAAGGGGEGSIILRFTGEVHRG